MVQAGNVLLKKDFQEPGQDPCLGTCLAVCGTNGNDSEATDQKITHDWQTFMAGSSWLVQRSWKPGSGTRQEYKNVKLSVTCDIDKSGKVSTAKLEKSSGKKEADDLAGSPLKVQAMQYSLWNC